MEKKVMIVNGDETTRKALRDALITAKHNVVTAPTVKDAIEQAQHGDFDVLITEMRMPDVSGIEVLRKFKQMKSNVCLIVVTAYNSVPLAVEAMKEGAFDYITKPFNPDEITIVVDRAMERQRLMREAQEKERYKELALLDGLTNVYNYRYFQEMLTREIHRAQRYPQQVSLLMIDVDDFKKYNDAYGHPAGDEVLKKVGQILMGSTRKIDLVARYGGEEFVIILPETTKKGSSIVATRIIALLDKIEFYDKKNIFNAHVTVSIGLASYPEDAQTKDDLIVKADQALYQAKKLGKNRICLFAP